MKRSPIVAVLGHVDHGKSTLLDALRKSRITEGEPGGMTQSIGAYRLAAGGHEFTFIDTPGHEAFANMRSRGAQVADIGVLVVAADDGVQPQTVESIAHLTHSAIPFVVAINKIDVSTARPDRVKAQLAENGAAVEGYGGTIPVVEMSAKLGTHLPDLLDMIWLVWELQDAPPEAGLSAPVIDSKLDPRRGPLVSVVVRHGTLSVKDSVAAGEVSGKVRALISDSGARTSIARPGDPVQILGFTDLPPIGAVVRRAGDPVPAAADPSDQSQKSTDASAEKSEYRQRLVLKADTPETTQVLRGIVPQDAEILLFGVGEITESDVLFARSTASAVVGFRVAPSASARRLARREEVRIVTDDVIYKLLDQLEALRKEQAAPPRRARARAAIVKVFKIGDQTIAGCLVTSGKFSTGDQVAIMEKDQEIGSGVLTQLKKRAKTVSEAKAQEECGMLLSPPDGEKLKFAEGNDIIAFQ